MYGYLFEQQKESFIIIGLGACFRAFSYIVQAVKRRNDNLFYFAVID
jgi:hypothetical protein